MKATLKTVYEPMYPQKYNGTYPIQLKSSWELEFARRNCDLNPNCIQWAYEPVTIFYQDPLTGEQKPYKPDFLVSFVSAGGGSKTMLIEIKPAKEQLEAHARSRADAASQLRNRAKWVAAIEWCARRPNVEFQVLNEMQFFHGADKMRPPKRPARIARRKRR